MRGSGLDKPAFWQAAFEPVACFVHERFEGRRPKIGVDKLRFGHGKPSSSLLRISWLQILRMRRSLRTTVRRAQPICVAISSSL